jgi:hypothetical protein
MSNLSSTVKNLQSLPASDQWVSRFALTSTSGRTYTIAQRRGSDNWQCSCPGHIYQKGPAHQKKPCKHLRAMGVAA